MYKEILNLHNTKTNNLILKWPNISPKIYRGLISTWKNVQLVIREMQIKTTRRNHYTPIRMAKIKMNDHTKCWQDTDELSDTARENKKWYSQFGKLFGNFLKILRTHLLYDPLIPH